MIDLHLHILPGVDDGPATLEESVEMARLAAADGCTTLIATPHQRASSFPNLDAALLRRRWEETREAVGDILRLELGAEVRADALLTKEIDAARATSGSSGPLMLAGTRWMLVELDFYGRGIQPETIVGELVARGIRPILAHPERVASIAGQPERARALVERGATMQITAGSVLGDFGRTARVASHDLLEDGLVHFLASDAHGVSWRPPGLSEARRLVAAVYGEEMARRLTEDNPLAVLEDRPLPAVGGIGGARVGVGR